ncbi:hypothetical protein [Streptomyces sp. NBC_00154]|uniref:hypothetical protein n=1 Tax=Streptomyces sp. NBC_00154 TaxID=2975670 RepID=UPI0022546C44|nr:hypothetical protein [Streptomyces sp. NBC_00154]MCX5318091.1 hypothetical protein [Streptomyces sp. NBC_00154]
MTRSIVPHPTNARALDENGVVVRGAEPAPATTIMRHMVYGSGLTRALDYVVLLHALFRLEENQAFTPKDIWRDLQAEGVRSAKNANELVGRDAVYESFNRLIAAKFIRRMAIDGTPGRFGKVRYELFRQPAYNPDYALAKEAGQPQDDLHVPYTSQPLPGTPDADKVGSKTAGHTASRNAGCGLAGSDVPGSGPRRIPAGQTASGVPGSGDGRPPTPPYREEEDSSSLKPSSNTLGASATAVAAAAEFLAELPGRWACGRKSAAELAPLLAEAVQEQGWPLGADLVTELTRRYQARRSTVSVLRDRVQDLPRYQAVRKALSRERSSGVQVPGQPSALPRGDHAQPADAALPEGMSAERAEEARVFLEGLTGPWALSPESAARLAPLLAAKTLERGWEFDSRLLSQLMSNPTGVNNYELILETHRIGRLPERNKATGEARRAAERRPAEGMCERHPWFRDGDCGPCRAAERDRERAAATDAGQPAPTVPEVGVPAHVADYIQALAAGAAADDAERRNQPELTAQQRQRLAQEQEHARRHEAHNAALNA